MEGRRCCVACHANRTKHQHHREDRLWKMALHHYGGATPRCSCCGCIRMAFLTVSKTGPIVRAAVGSARLYYQLQQKNYPDGYAVFCQNCNFERASDAEGICRCGGVVAGMLAGGTFVPPAPRPTEIGTMPEEDMREEEEAADAGLVERLIEAVISHDRTAIVTLMPLILLPLIPAVITRCVARHLMGIDALLRIRAGMTMAAAGVLPDRVRRSWEGFFVFLQAVNFGRAVQVLFTNPEALIALRARAAAGEISAEDIAREFRVANSVRPRGWESIVRANFSGNFARHLLAAMR